MENDRWKAGLSGLVLLAALGVLCPLLAAPYIPLTDPDEGKIAAIAQKMVESGDWIVPRMLDEPFLERPILYFWAIAASLKIFGMSEAAVRLPGLLFGMFGTLTTAAVGWRILGRRTGLIAGLFYASMVLPLALVQLPGYDVALVTWVNLALLCFWESDCGGSGRRAWAWTATAGAALGLAILTKGLVGLVLVGIAYGGYLLVSRRLRVIHGFRAGLALSVAAVLGSWWYLAMEHSNPGYLHYYFLGRHVLGFFTRSQPHGREPWWYYIPVIIVGGIPWVGYLPVLVRDAISRWRKQLPAVADARDPEYRVPHRPLLLLGCWFVGWTLFLTISRSKLLTYMWPAFPALAILTAIVWARKIDGVLSEGEMVDGPDRLVYLPARPVGPAGRVRRHADCAANAVLAAGMDVGGRGGADDPGAIVELVAGRDRLTLGLAVTTVCGQLVVLLVSALPPVAVTLSGRDLADYFNRTRELPSRVLMAREQIGSAVFYLDRDLRSQLHRGQMANQDLDNPLPLPVLDRQEWIVVAERGLRLALVDYNLSSLPYERAGRFRLYRRSDLEPWARVGQADRPLLR